MPLPLLRLPEDELLLPLRLPEDELLPPKKDDEPLRRVFTELPLLLLLLPRFTLGAVEGREVPDEVEEPELLPGRYTPEPLTVPCEVREP